MDVGDWITLGAVLVALGIGVASILYTQSLQKKERKEKLLNEIIEWAENVTRVNFGGEITAAPSKVIQGRLANVNRLLGCQLLEVKGKGIIKQSALSINQELGDAVNNILNSLNVVINVLKQGVPYDESEEAKGILIANNSVLEQNIRNLLNMVSESRKTKP